MSEPNKAVFLSYASQDAEAARRICDALRAAGIEVWFDQSELRGGDLWDRQIRKQIHDCALFIPSSRRRRKGACKVTLGASGNSPSSTPMTCLSA